MKRSILLLLPALLLLLLPGGLAAQYDNPDGPGGGGDCSGANVVKVQDNVFVPDTITIDVGDTVTWCYEGPSGTHNVREESGAFRCANGCDGSGGDGDPAANGWSFRITFNEAGTVDYFCEVHVALGMTGTVIVEGDGGGDGGGGDDGGGDDGGGDDGGGDDGGGDGGGGDGGGGDGGGDDGGGDGGGDDSGPGELAFGSFAFGTGEGGNATVEVVRTGGTGGQVAADFSTSAGSASAGGDYTPNDGTVTLGDGEATATIAIPIATDGAREPVETFSIALSNPSGGATLGPVQTATVLIFDDDEVQEELTSEQVLCDGFRLAGLLDRIALRAPNTSKPLGVNLSFTRSGDFFGLAYTGNGPGTAEHHLWFSTNPEETTLLRNPSRPQLAAVSLSRNQTNSDLVARNAADLLELLLNPTLQASPAPAALLTVNDVGDPVTREGGTPAQSKPGRGLSTLVQPCHDLFSSRDRHVFQVLAKIARASADGGADTEIAIFRGEARDTYRLDVYPVAPSGASMGRLAAELEIDFGPGDRLDGGTLRVLGPCGPSVSADCTSVAGFTELQLVEPKFSGEFWNDSPYSVSTDTPESSVDFSDLLQGTSWRSP